MPTRPNDTLRELQRLIRRPPSKTGQPVMTKAFPPDLTGGRCEGIELFADEVKAMHATVGAIQSDLAYEHLRDPEEAVWRFVAECRLDRTIDHVEGFIERYRHEIDERDCYLPVEHLSVTDPLALHTMKLLPLGHAEVPTEGRWFNLRPPVGCVAAVPVRGTSSSLMAERARHTAEHELRILRVALREDRAIHDYQLRFRLSTTYSFGERGEGTAERDDVAYGLTLDEELLSQAKRRPVFRLPTDPTTDIERKAHVAVRWLERARMTGEPLVALLFYFFALEALLGDKAEGLKAHGLAFRQMMLGHVAQDGFFHPNETWFLYDKVRSGAVHGEAVPEVTPETIRSFSPVVLTALGQYLKVASDQGFRKRGRLLAYLKDHPDRPQAIGWLRANGGDSWTSYLDELEGGP